VRGFWIVPFVSLLSAEPLRWADIPVPMRPILEGAGVDGSTFSGWLAGHRASAERRLAAGAAEHVAYYLLQTLELEAGEALDPAVEARKYWRSLGAGERAALLKSDAGCGTSGCRFSEPVRRRVIFFGSGAPRSERHRLLRRMAARLGWPVEEMVQTAFRFLLLRSEAEDADGLYQKRGLSTDPFAGSMLGVERGLAMLGGPRDRVLLVGPGAELGSRFGLADSRPVRSPQPEALLTLLGKRPEVFDCVDIREEVAVTLAAGPCRAVTLDVAADRLEAQNYDLAVATNVLVYLDEVELAAAFANFGRALRPGGCLFHNDSRFAARVYGEMAGIPVLRFEAIALGVRGGREQVDRVVVHCKPKPGP
jgi:SAM-dependent methyltransferase